MSVLYDGEYYDFLPPPPFGGYKRYRVSPKIKFQADGGYLHQQDRYPDPQVKVELEITSVSAAGRNLIEAFLDEIRSTTFWYVLPESLVPRPDGTIRPVGILARVTGDEIDESPTKPGQFTIKLVLTSQGPAVTGTAPTEG